MTLPRNKSIFISVEQYRCTIGMHNAGGRTPTHGKKFFRSIYKTNLTDILRDLMEQTDDSNSGDNSYLGYLIFLLLLVILVILAPLTLAMHIENSSGTENPQYIKMNIQIVRMFFSSRFTYY